MNAFGSRYTTPGWQRAQGRRGMGGFDETGQPRYVADEEIFDEAGGGPRSYADRTRDLTTTSPPPLRGRDREGGHTSPKRRRPLTIEGELVAKSTGTASLFSIGERVFHQKFGNGNVTAVDGNKLTIAFDKAGEKRVVDSFVERV
jgi:DNA helicase-2/ATP-dependent DNA helicase PcrA